MTHIANDGHVKDSVLAQQRLLEAVKSLVKEDNRIIGLWAVGSLATGRVDRYSDLDLYLLVEKEKYEQVYSERASFAQRMGTVLSSFEVEFPNCQLYGVIFENCIEVDLCYCKPEQLEIFGPYKIIVDKGGNLPELFSKYVVKFEIDVKKRLIEQLDFAAYNLLHAINMLGRGEFWSSIRQIELLRKRIITLIGFRTQSDVEEEYRRLESLIDSHESRLLEKTLCSYNFESINKTIRVTTTLFIQEAEKLCRAQELAFPTERFERLVEYLNEICFEKEKQSKNVQD